MIKVEATKLGFYGNRRRYPKGHPKFETFSVKEVDGSWMKPVATKEVNPDESNEENPEETESSKVVEPNQGGEQSPPQQTDSVGQDGEGSQQELDQNDTPEEDEKSAEKLSESQLRKLKKDDLIAKASELGLSENINLVEFTNAQLIDLILEAYEQESPNE